MLFKMASNVRISTRANKDNRGLVKRSNVVVILLKPSPVVDAISPSFVPKKKERQEISKCSKQGGAGLDTVDYCAVACVSDFVKLVGPDPIVCSLVGPDPVVCRPVEHDPVVCSPIGPNPVVCSLVGPDLVVCSLVGLNPVVCSHVGPYLVVCSPVGPNPVVCSPVGPYLVVCSPIGPNSVIPSPTFDISGWQTLFVESNWSHLSLSPSFDILVVDYVPKSLNLVFLPLLDSVSKSLVPESPNCVSQVFLTNSDESDEIEVDLVGVSTTVQPCRFLPLNPNLVEKVKELKRGKSYKNNNWAINWLNAWRKNLGRN